MLQCGQSQAGPCQKTLPEIQIKVGQVFLYNGIYQSLKLKEVRDDSCEGEGCHRQRADPPGMS